MVEVNTLWRITHILPCVTMSPSPHTQQTNFLLLPSVSFMYHLVPTPESFEINPVYFWTNLLPTLRGFEVYTCLYSPDGCLNCGKLCFCLKRNLVFSAIVLRIPSFFFNMVLTKIHHPPWSRVSARSYFARNFEQWALL
jgi:hypothetical protein